MLGFNLNSFIALFGVAIILVILGNRNSHKARDPEDYEADLEREKEVAELKELIEIEKRK